MLLSIGDYLEICLGVINLHFDYQSKCVDLVFPETRRQKEPHPGWNVCPGKGELELFCLWHCQFWQAVFQFVVVVQHPNESNKKYGPGECSKRKRLCVCFIVPVFWQGIHATEWHTGSKAIQDVELEVLGHLDTGVAASWRPRGRFVDHLGGNSILAGLAIADGGPGCVLGLVLDPGAGQAFWQGGLWIVMRRSISDNEKVSNSRIRGQCSQVIPKHRQEALSKQLNRIRLGAMK